MVGMSIPIASGLVGDLRGVTLRLGSALPSVLPLPAGRRGLPGPAKASGGDRGGRIISQVGRHPRVSMQSLDAGRDESPQSCRIPAWTFCPAPPPSRAVGLGQSESSTEGRCW